MNILDVRQAQTIGDLFKAVGDPFRIRLLLALEGKETCVCHLERLLDKRQAYISQHLMSLRQAGLLKTRREGRFVYYRLTNPEIVVLIHKMAAGLGVHVRKNVPTNKGLTGCDCPQCDSVRLVSIK